MRSSALYLVLPVVGLLACAKPSAGPGPAGSSAPAEGAQTIAATVDGEPITLKELDATIARELHALRREGLEQLIAQRLIEREAKRAHSTAHELLHQVSDEGVKSKGPTPEAMQKAFAEAQSVYPGKSFEELRPMFEAKAREDAISEYLDGLRSKSQVKILLASPRVQLPDDGPSQGPKGAKVTLVELSDFQCPYCAEARKTVESLLAAYAGKLRVVFLNFPLPSHPLSKKAAEAGLCADEQGKFWPLHDRMFEAQSKLSIEEIKASARAVGLDAAKFDSCLDSGRLAPRVAQTVRAGEEAGVDGTPSFFVNGKPVVGNRTFESLRQAIDEELLLARDLTGLDGRQFDRLAPRPTLSPNAALCAAWEEVIMRKAALAALLVAFCLARPAVAHAPAAPPPDDALNAQIDARLRAVLEKLARSMDGHRSAERASAPASP